MPGYFRHALSRSLTHTAGAQLDFHVRNGRAGYSQHQRRGVAEVADPGDRSCALGKVVDLAQPLPDVLEFLLCVLDVVEQADRHYGDVVLRRGFHPVHFAVPCRSLLDLSRH